MQPRKYAEGTEVPAERSRNELEKLLRAHGATEFAQFTGKERTIFMYRLHGMMIRHTVEYPGPACFPKPGLSPEQRVKVCEAEWRRRWRALVLICKAKLEIVAAGGSTFEREFLADLVLADGQTMAQAVLPRLKEMYETGAMPDFPLLLGSGG